MASAPAPRPRALPLGILTALPSAVLLACGGGAMAMEGGPVPGPEAPAPSAVQDGPGPLNLLIASLTLDRAPLSDTIFLYESDDDVLLPVGELARLLTLGITVDPVERTASGFILSETAGFRIETGTGRVTLPDREEEIDPGRLRWIDGELYAPSRMLSRWWPVDFRFSMNALTLAALPREKLPIQLRLERERAASRLSDLPGEPADPGFPRLPNPYSLFSVPVVDASLGIGSRRQGDEIKTTVEFNAGLAGDFLGMEAAGYLSVRDRDGESRARLTLSRTDPSGALLGPLQGTRVQLGDVGLPALKNVLSGSGGGWGATLTNRPLNVSSSYGLQTLRGELPPGWDVTLYFNEALIAFAQSRGDGLYEFPDQPLVFGRNEFRLVFNGPQGQRRVETQVFTLDQTVTRPGEAHYYLGAQRSDDRTTRSTFQMDFGLAKGLALTAGAVHIERQDNRQTGRPLNASYINTGLRVAGLGSLFNLDHTFDPRGGGVTEIGVRTQIRGVAVEASRTWLHDFASDDFALIEDPLRVRDQVRLTGSILLPDSLRLPYAVDMRHEATVSGIRTFSLQPRLSLNAGGASITNALDWRVSPGSDSIAGSLQANRRVAGVGVTGQVAYTLRPGVKLGSLAMTFDKTLGENNRLNVGLVQAFRSGKTTVTAGWSRNLGAFSVGLSGVYGGARDFGVGVQITTALGRNPRSGAALRDWRPLAGSGVVAAKVFLDSNLNNRFDEGEQPISNAGFKVNGGSRQGARTDDRGETLLMRLQPGAYADIALDLSTLDDAQWQSAVPGVRVLPRPGKVQVLDFPVVLTAEIDGTIYLEQEGRRRGIGNARLQLLDADGRMVGETTSAGDGYYIMPNVRPGRYLLRVAPDQLATLRLLSDAAREVVINAQAEFVNGVDITLSRMK